MTVSVDLSVAKLAQALTLPSSAIRGAGTGSPSVLIVQNDRVRAQPIALGIRGDDRTQVLSGLDEHTLVISSDVRALAVGQRVRAFHKED
jgi:HlyD family secretion protein